MRRLLVIPLMLAGLLLAACGSKEPQIVLEIIDIDFGDVFNGDVVVRDVAVTNNGEGILTVDNVSSSCGCTQASLDKMEIGPGESATLHIEFDSGAHGPELTGPLKRIVFINSNDPEQPEAKVEIAANILAPSSP